MTFVITGTPEWAFGIDDPNLPLMNDVNNLYNDRHTLMLEKQDIADALAQMEADLKSPNKEKVFQAMMIALTQVFPAIEQFKGDNIKQLADNENIASDLRAFITGAQTAFNDTTTNDGSNNADMLRGLKIYETLNALWDGSPNAAGDSQSLQVNFILNGQRGSESWLNLLTDKSIWGDNTPLDSTNKNYLTQSIGSIENLFTKQDKDGKEVSFWGPGTDNAALIGGAVAWWYQTSTTPSEHLTDPTKKFDPKTNPYIIDGPPVPAPQLKTEQSALQQATQSTSTQATSLQSQEQFYTQEFNQLIGIDNSIKQSEASQVTTLVKNQKSA